MEIMLSRRLAPGGLRRFEFVEKESELPSSVEPGFEQFLKDGALSGNTTEDEIEFLRRLKFCGRHPTPIYYYRELQNVRGPLHFQAWDNQL
jgi:hypothetical protein